MTFLTRLFTFTALAAALAALAYVHFYLPGQVEVMWLGWVIHMPIVVALGAAFFLAIWLFAIGYVWEWLAVVPVKWRHNREQKQHTAWLAMVTDAVRHIVRGEPAKARRLVTVLRGLPRYQELATWLGVLAENEPTKLPTASVEAMAWAQLRLAQTDENWSDVMAATQQLMALEVQTEEVKKAALQAALHLHQWEKAKDFLAKMSDQATLKMFVERQLTKQMAAPQTEKELAKQWRAQPTKEGYVQWQQAVLVEYAQATTAQKIKLVQALVKPYRHKGDYQPLACWAEAQFCFEIKAWEHVRTALADGLKQGVYQELLMLKAQVLAQKDKQAEQAYHLMEQAYAAPSVSPIDVRESQAYQALCWQYGVASHS